MSELWFRTAWPIDSELTSFCAHCQKKTVTITLQDPMSSEMDRVKTGIPQAQSQLQGFLHLFDSPKTAALGNPAPGLQRLVVSWSSAVLETFLRRFG